jgi:CheY-like chemotaxis protein
LSCDLHVLVVDDHPVNRRILSDIFSQLGCVVATAHDGLDALAASSVEAFDLICLDRHMPGLGGDDIVYCLPREQFVLAWSTDERDLPGRFNGTLAKPVTVTGAAAAMAAAGRWRREMDRSAARRARRFAA